MQGDSVAGMVDAGWRVVKGRLRARGGRVRATQRWSTVSHAGPEGRKVGWRGLRARFGGGSVPAGRAATTSWCTSCAATLASPTWSPSATSTSSSAKGGFASSASRSGSKAGAAARSAPWPCSTSRGARSSARTASATASPPWSRPPAAGFSRASSRHRAKRLAGPSASRVIHASFLRNSRPASMALRFASRSSGAFTAASRTRRVYPVAVQLCVKLQTVGGAGRDTKAASLALL